MELKMATKKNHLDNTAYYSSFPWRGHFYQISIMPLKWIF